MKKPRPSAPDTAAARAAIIQHYTRYVASHDAGGRRALADFVVAWNAGRIDAPAWVREAIATLSVSTFYGWVPRQAAGGTAALADARKGNGTASAIDGDPELRDFITGMIYHRPHLTARAVREAVGVRFPDRNPPERSLRRWIAAWRRDNAGALQAVANPDAWRSSRRVSFGRADEGVTALNALWEMDSTPADGMLKDEDGKLRRHAVVGVIEVYSRRAMVLAAPTSRSTVIAALMRRALIAWGVPRTIRTDEGADYTSRHLVRVYGDLEIVHDSCPPFTPEAKPFIERFIGTISSQLFELLPGYTGHSVADAQAIRSRRSFSERFGDGDRPTVAIALTLGEFQQRCDAWTEAVYARRPHDGIGGETPFDMARAWTQPIRRIENDRALDVLLADAPGDGWRVVGKQGLRIDRGVYIAPELGALVGERVAVRYDPADLGRVYVFDADGLFVCAAEDPNRTGIDRAEIAARARALQRQHVADARREAKRLVTAARPETIMDEILDAAQAEADRVVALPRPGVSHETPALDAAAEAAEVMDLVSGATPELVVDNRKDGPAADDPLSDDLNFYFWTLDHPDAVSDGQAAYAAELMESPSFRLLVQAEHERRARRAAKTA